MFDALSGAVSETLRNMTDLPGDVYGALAELPDSTSLSKRFRALGTECLEVAIPVVRQVNSAAARMPYGSFLQPILLGKLFAVRDYVADRKAALQTIPELPGDLRKELMSVSDFLRNHHEATESALEALPPLDELRRVTSPRFWEELWSEELARELKEIDAGYREVVSDPYRLEDELSVYRAVYAITYHALGSVDPVTGALASLTPGAVTAYRHFAARREQLARIVARLEEAGVDTGASAPATSPATASASADPAGPTQPVAPASPEPALADATLPEPTLPEPTLPEPAVLPAVKAPEPSPSTGAAASAEPSALVPSGRLPAPLSGSAEGAKQRVQEALKSSGLEEVLAPIIEAADAPKLNALAIVVESTAPDLDGHREVAEPMLAGKAAALADYLNERERFLEEAPGPMRAEVEGTDAFFHRHRDEIREVAAEVPPAVSPYMIDHWLRSIGEGWERFESEIGDHFPAPDQDRRTLFYAFYSSAYTRLAAMDDAKQAVRALDTAELRRGRTFHDKHQLVDPVRFKLEMSSAWKS